MTDPALEEAIRALAHPCRRAMLRLVWDDERPATEPADAAGYPGRAYARTDRQR